MIQNNKIFNFRNNKIIKLKEELYLGLLTAVKNQHQSCIDACRECAQVCFECFEACLNEPDVAARKQCISTLFDCAELCQLAMGYMSRNSVIAKNICELCANVCHKCAQECAMFKDDHCQQCADTCRKCAAECQKMASM